MTISTEENNIFYRGLRENRIEKFVNEKKIPRITWSRSVYNSQLDRTYSIVRDETFCAILLDYYENRAENKITARISR